MQVLCLDFDDTIYIHEHIPEMFDVYELVQGFMDPLVLNDMLSAGAPHRCVASIIILLLLLLLLHLLLLLISTTPSSKLYIVVHYDIPPKFPPPLFFLSPQAFPVVLGRQYARQRP